MKVLKFGNDYVQQQIAAGIRKAEKRSIVNIEDYGRVQPEEEAKIAEPVVDGGEVAGGEEAKAPEAKKKGKAKNKA